MAKKQSLFSPLDLILPIGPFALSAVLGAMGILKGETLPAKLISLAPALVFGAATVWWYITRNNHLACDVVTSYGLKIRWGKKNKWAPDVISEWTKELVGLWKQPIPLPSGIKLEGRNPVIGADGVYEALNNALAIFLDVPRFRWQDKWVLGLQTGGRFRVTYDKSKGAKYTKDIFIHEASHVVLVCNGWKLPTETQHEIFRRMGIPYS
jgi:hypothetical protein